MGTDYDQISDDYKRAKVAPWRRHVECFTLYELVGDASGLSVLDLACGEGFHTRALKERGASRVVGVDLSAGMIDLARQEEDRHPLGIDYVVRDVMGLDLGEQFDVVFAAWLLNYATNADELRQMADAIVRHLRPGGRFVTINNNPDYSGELESMRKYDFTREAPEPIDGAETEWTFFLPDGTLSILNYYLSRETHQQVLTAAGLRDLRWLPPQVSPEGIADDGAEFWADLVDCEPMVFLTATC